MSNGGSMLARFKAGDRVFNGVTGRSGNVSAVGWDSFGGKQLYVMVRWDNYLTTEQPAKVADLCVLPEAVDRAPARKPTLEAIADRQPVNR
jgi:hypothetical protein